MASSLKTAHDLAEVIEAHADDAERQRRLPEPTVRALTDGGFMRMCLPSEYGGDELDPMTSTAIISALAYADGAAGWCSMIASTTSSMAAFLPEAGAREIYGDLRAVTGGVFAPNGIGTVVDDGVTVSGRWAWGSGTQHCDWILGGARCDDQTFRLCWFPHDDVTFHDTWHTGGMRGSGSLDYEVGDVVVPHHRTMQPGVTTPRIDTALFRFPNFSLLAASVAAVGLGVARRALDEIVEIAEGKRPQYSSRTLAKQAYTQIELARAEGRLRATQAYLSASLSSAWETVSAGHDASLDQRTDIRLAAVHAASEAAAVADVAFTLAGGTAVYDTSVLGRCQRDAHVVTQHIQTAPKLYERVGRLRLGLDDDVSMW
ncbi:MAG: acyl-CoA dehydrogenase family protein [Actinomycetota bacterium]